MKEQEISQIVDYSVKALKMANRIADVIIDLQEIRDLRCVYNHDAGAMLVDKIYRKYSRDLFSLFIPTIQFEVRLICNWSDDEIRGNLQTIANILPAVAIVHFGIERSMESLFAKALK